MLRDTLLARLREMGDRPDYRRLAVEVLGIRGAPEALAQRLVAQALVLEDRQDAWRRAGERIVRDAPSSPGVYVLRDAEGIALYVGKAINLRRRLAAHFAERRWRALKPQMARAVAAEWEIVGSEIEALLREAVLIAELQPVVNVQVGSPALDSRALPEALVRDVIAIARSVEDDSVELVAARADGGWLIQRTRRDGSDLAVHVLRLRKFFGTRRVRPEAATPPLAPLVFSWLAGRGSAVTRIDPHDARSAGELRRRLAAVIGDPQLFLERLVIYS